jgi:hypothetical protein
LPKPTRTVLLFVLALSALSVLSVCKATTSEPVQAEFISGTLYQLQNGRFSPLPKGGQPSTTPLQPWTVQQRVSDLVALGEGVYLGVNGHGIAQLDLEADGEIGFNYFYDPLIFRYRTLTTLIPEGVPDAGSLLCHLYFNRLLNVIDQTELKLQGISLLRLIPSSGVYAFLTPPYQEEHPDWEAVGFVPVAPQEFYIQWKYSDRNRTLFFHSHFDLAGLREEEVEALAYRKSYGFEDTQQTSALREILAEARKHLDAPGISTAYQFHMRCEDRPLMRRYEYHPPDFTNAEEIRLYTLSGFNRGNSYLMLLPDGLLLQGSSESRQIRHFQLPPLPEKFVYTHLLLHGGNLIAGWEQTAFTDVGAAGIFFAAIALIP